LHTDNTSQPLYHWNFLKHITSLHKSIHTLLQ